MLLTVCVIAFLFTHKQKQRLVEFLVSEEDFGYYCKLVYQTANDVNRNALMSTGLI